jgi:hypothetical protein
MKEFLIVRASNNFDDILKDPNLKKKFSAIMQYNNSLLVQLDEDDSAVSYMMLKYGEDIIDLNSAIPDRTPIAGKDYTVQRKDVKVRFSAQIN